MTREISQQPASIAPAALNELSLRAARTRIVFQQTFSPTGAVLTVRDRFVAVFEGVYALKMADRTGVVFAPGTGEMGHSVTLSAVRNQPGLDVLIPIADDPTEARIDVGEALRLAQQTRRAVIPIGIGCGACLPLKRSSLPLPLARVVVMVDAPFEVPEQTLEIPPSWVDTIIRLLKQIDGRAQDHLATWRKSARAFS